MQTQPYDYLIKLIILGDSYVGKTSLIKRFTDSNYSGVYKTSIGIDYVYKNVQLDKYIIKMQIWDTAGQEKFRTLTRSYFNNANGALVVFSIDNKQSFQNIKIWMKKLEQTLKDRESLSLVLIGNKVDVNIRHVQYEQGVELAKEYGIPYYECSAKLDINVNKAFQQLATVIIQKILQGNSSSIYNDKRSFLKNQLTLKNCC